MASYAQAEKWRNAASGALSLGATGAGVGFTIGGPVGAGIGAGAGVLLGALQGALFTDDEKNEMIEMYRRGELDDQTVANIESTIARRFQMIRRSQDAGLARRGLSGSTFAARQMQETYNAERESLADAITRTSEHRKAIGFGMSDAAGAQRAQDVAHGIGAAFQGVEAYQTQQRADADAARSDVLLAALGQLTEGTPATRKPSPIGAPKVSNPQTGAGNAFARHRTRMPNTSPFLSTDLETAFRRKPVRPTWIQ